MYATGLASLLSYKDIIELGINIPSAVGTCNAAHTRPNVLRLDCRCRCRTGTLTTWECL